MTAHGWRPTSKTRGPALALVRAAALAPAAALILGLGACAAQSPDDMAGQVDGGAGGGADAAPGAVPLSVDPLPSSTSWLSLPVTGHGPAGGTLVYDTPMAGEQTIDLPQDGNFCVDVRLHQGTGNTLRFQAIDQDGTFSDSVTVNVAQDGQPPDPTPSPDPDPAMRDVLLGATQFRQHIDVAEGQLSNLVDGDLSNYVKLKKPWDLSSWWIAIGMTERASVDHIRIRSVEDCDLGDVAVLLSDQEDPGEACNGCQDWSLQQYISDATTDMTIEPPLANPTARWIGLDFDGHGCAPFYTTSEHRILEVEVWTHDAAGGSGDPTPDQGPSCAGGGLD